MNSPHLRWFQTLRQGAWPARLSALVCSGGLIGFGLALNSHYPLREWLFWRIALLWLYVAVYSCSCVGVGLVLLRRAFRVPESAVLESWLLGMAAGQAAFVVSLYGFGAIGAFHPAMSIALPILCLAVGWRDLVRLVGRTVSTVRERRADGTVFGDLTVKVASAWALLGLAIIYIIGFTPATISLDAAWYHLPVAHDYVRAGGLIPFPSEYNRNFPQMNSIVFTWAFMLPGMEHPFDWMMALHLDYSMILWKALGVAVGAHIMLGESRTRGLWTGFFLFPMVFTFANSVSGGPEHFSGFWTIPMFVATLRMLKDLDPRWCAILGVFAGGAILSRYQSVYMIAACGAFIAARWVWLLVADLRGQSIVPRKRLWIAPLLVIGLGSAVAAPHFIKNFVFYGDPLYPFLVDKIPGVHPTHPEAVAFFKSTLGSEGARPKFQGLGRVAAGFQYFFTFSFRPSNVVVKQLWPFFGSLFTLLLPCALFVRSPGRIWIGIGCCFVVISVWCNLYLQTRYLNTASTIFAATAVALIVRVWELGLLARVMLVPLVLLQAIWGLDSATYTGDGPIISTLKLARSGWAGKLDPEARYPWWRGFKRVTEATPEDAQILVRGPRMHLGLDRYAHRDVQSQQGNFYYGPLRTAQELWQHYRERGITHVLFKRNHDYAGTLQSSVLFSELVARQGMPQQKFGAWDLVELAPEPPIEAGPLDVLVLGVAAPYSDGVYQVEDLTVRKSPKPAKGAKRSTRETVPPRTPIANTNEAQAALPSTEVVVVGDAQMPSFKTALKSRFELFGKIGEVSLYVRKKADSPAPSPVTAPSRTPSAAPPRPDRAR